MRAVVGVFRTLSDAERAIDGLRRLGLGEDRLSLLTPREEFRDGYERGVDYSLGMRERRDRAA